MTEAHETAVNVQEEAMWMLQDVPGDTIVERISRFTKWYQDITTDYARLQSEHAAQTKLYAEALAREEVARKALEDLAQQKTTSEIEAEEEGSSERADFVGAYEAMIEIARDALSQIKGEA